MSKTTIKSSDTRTNYLPLLENQIASDPAVKDKYKDELVESISCVIRVNHNFAFEDDVIYQDV